MKRTGDIHSPLFAATYAYQPHRQLTQKQRLQAQTTYHPTKQIAPWAEYAGHSQHRYVGYSPLVMEAKSRQAQAVFAQAQYTLSKLRSRW